MSAPVGMLDAWDEANDRTQVAGLPVREWEVLVGLAGGLTRFQIGEKHRLSPNTVITYRNRLFRRLGVHSAYEAVQAAWRHGMFRTCPTCRRPR